MNDLVRSIDRVCRVELVRGKSAPADAVPDYLFEVPHGATRAHHFDSLCEELCGDYGAGLRDFFFVNTDVGAPELARQSARELVAARPSSSALVICCDLPRTLIDTNRVIDRNAVGAASKAGEMTPGLPPWVVADGDRELLLSRYFAYQEVVAAAFALVCGSESSAESSAERSQDVRTGRALCVHTYAPRSLQVDVDEDIGKSLRAAYAPDRIESWPLRAEVDLITHDEQGQELADVGLAARAEREFAAAGFPCARNGTYALHASTSAYEYARRYPGRTLCLELRRDLLLDAFVPFVELVPNDAAVARAAKPLVQALLGDAD
ncbi:MAG: hypothetical protein AB8H80_05220 [Planctomycetota bacterium]